MKTLARISLLSLAALLVLAIVYYKERVLFADAPHILFRIINEGTLKIEENRWGAFITQLFPLVLSKLHAPLPAILFLYSISFNLFYTAVGFVLYKVYKRYDLVVLLTLYFTVFATATFYWTNNEVHQGMAWLCLATAITEHGFQKQQHPLLAGIVFTPLYALAIWTHPLVMLVAVFYWIFYLIFSKENTLIGWQKGAFTVILSLLCFAKFWQGMHHGYDSGKIEQVTTFSATKLRDIFSYPQWHFFYTGIVKHYWLLPVCIMGSIIALGKENKYLFLVAYIIYIGLYVALICITYPAMVSPFYIESEYMPLSVIAALPMVMLLLPKLPLKATGAAWGCFLVFKFILIVLAAKPFEERLSLLTLIEKQMQVNKTPKLVLIDNAHILDKPLILVWGAPTETMLISALKGHYPQNSCLVIDSAQWQNFNTQSSDTLLSCFEKKTIRQMNPHYFCFDTTHSYITITGL
ncbi:MAG: hypothetical protein EBX41_07165 [Chitinophagia bacterium]|nr:hypothetical protein [Chitinophagia bacterium]